MTTSDHPYTTALIRTALQIADQAVVCDIETEGRQIGAPSERRWDVSAMFCEHEHSPEFLDMAQQAIGYGLVRGLLELDATRRWTVRILRDLPT